MSSTFSHGVGSSSLTLESGKLAQQANGATLVRYGDNVMLATATRGRAREGIDFFPLTIDFEERLYSRGKVPGSFFRREGRPSTHATLIARLTDRPIRPLFPKGFRDEIQVILTSLSTDMEYPLDILGIIGASAALCISDIPFDGPVGATRMGYVDGEFVVNPTFAQMEESKLDLIVAGTKSGVSMMEAGVQELSESLVLEGIQRAQDINQEVIRLQEDLVRAIGKPKTPFEAEVDTDLDQRVASAVDGGVSRILASAGGPKEQDAQLDSLKTEVVEGLGEAYATKDVQNTFRSLVDEAFRQRILDGGARPDGRRPREIREISCEVALLPRTHGTGLFSRGETQALGVVTLGSVGDAQKLDTLAPEEMKRFLLHYNFPPYSVGETRRVGSPGRREIGHGALAERAMLPVLPSQEEFPYTIRLVSEVLSSNGSTSMASVCACTLALMDAGVPIKAPVAGISVGLITGDDRRYVTLTDIQGLEDHVGDMDFKVAGTRAGITAIQLDIKVNSIGPDVIRDALEQAKEARLFLLDKINETISEARTEMSPFAPRMVRIMIPVDKIGIVIGPGGKTIRGIVEQTGATVDVENDGSVTIGSTSAEAADRAIGLVRDLTRDIEVGEIYTGKVVKTTGFGAFVELLPGRDGMVHISELADYRVPSVEDVVQVGEEITVMVTDIDDLGRVKLSRRALLERRGEPEDEDGDGPMGEDREDVEGGRPDPRQERPSPALSRPPSRGPGRPGGGGGGRGGYRPSGPRPGGQRGGPGSRPRPFGGGRPPR